MSEEEDLLNAIEKENVDRVMKLLKYVDLNHGYTGNMTPLHKIAFVEEESDKSIKIAYLLVRCGAIVNAKIEDTKETPLHFACYRGNVEIAKILIQFLADVNAKNEYGETPFYFGCNSDNAQMLKLLLKHKCNIFIPNKKGVYAYEKIQSTECGKLVMKHMHKQYKKKVKKILKLEDSVNNLQGKVKKYKAKEEQHKRESFKKKRKLLEEKDDDSSSDDENEYRIVKNNSEKRKKRASKDTLEKAEKLKELFEQRYGNKNLVRLAKRYRKARTLDPKAPRVFSTFQKIRKQISEHEKYSKDSDDDDDDDYEEKPRRAHEV